MTPQRACMVFAAIFAMTTTAVAREPWPASASAIELDRQINWDAARLLVVQEAGRYKTLESFARESLAAITRKPNLPGLSPVASVLELVFNGEAYADLPIVYVKEKAVRVTLAVDLDQAVRDRVAEEPYFTLHELTNPAVMQRIRGLAAGNKTRNAGNRVLNAAVTLERLDEFLAIVPQAGPDPMAPWYPPRQLLGSMTAQQLGALGLTRNDLPAEARFPLPHVTPETAWSVTFDWAQLRAAWLAGDASGVQQYLDRLVTFLPTLDRPGPTRPHHSAPPKPAITARASSRGAGSSTSSRSSPPSSRS